MASGSVRLTAPNCVFNTDVLSNLKRSSQRFCAKTAPFGKMSDSEKMNRNRGRMDIAGCNCNVQTSGINQMGSLSACSSKEAINFERKKRIGTKLSPDYQNLVTASSKGRARFRCLNLILPTLILKLLFYRFDI